MKYIIGLDIGIASVGWAVINMEKNRIEDLGARVFKKAEEPDGKALNVARREARSVRRRLRRKSIRMKKIKELFVKYNIITENELKSVYIIDEKSIDVWELRYKALDEILSAKDWVRVLTNIAKRRGYKSNRKTDEKDENVGKLSQGTNDNKKLYEEKNYRTIGEMFYLDPKFRLNKRNKGGEYANTVLRSLLIDEVHILFDKQRQFGSKYASKEFEEEYINIVTYQKDFLTPELLERMLGKCTFEKEEVRAPKNSYTFERFTLLQKINNLIIDINGEKYNLTEEQRRIIEKMAYEQSEVKYYQIRKKLKLPIDSRFNVLNYSIKNKEEFTEEEFLKKVEDKKFIKLEGWHKIRLSLKSINKDEKFQLIKDNPEIQNIISDALVRNKTDIGINKYLLERNIDKDLIDASLEINFTKFGHLSYKAMKKIIPFLEKGLTYDKACEEAGYKFKGTQNTLSYKLPAICDVPDTNILNPVVLRAVSQTRKVINAIIDKYGSPIAIHVETARDLAKSFDERQAIEKKQKENQATNNKIIEYIKENFGFDAKPFDIVKMKLWREQNGVCVYSQKPISVEKLFEEKYVEVDHIIPFSRCFDDSYSNKVLVLSSENQNKKERTPFEYMGENSVRWNKFEKFVEVTYKNNLRKKEHLLMKKFDNSKSEEWLQRNLNDTKYISKYIYSYITNNLKFAPSEMKRKVYNINGQATSILRHYWGLSKNREESDKHHAQDAVVIACATQANIKKISEYSKRKKLYNNGTLVNLDTGEIVENFIKEPWPKFREEVEARMGEADKNGQLYSLVNGNFKNYDDIDIEKVKPIFVSRMPERKITGRAHKDTMQSQKFIKQGYKFPTVKKALCNISKNEICSIVNNEKYSALYLSDKLTYDAIYKRMDEFEFKANRAFNDGYVFRKPSKNGLGAIVRSIKVPTSSENGIELKNKSIVANDSMVRVDVFEKDSKFYLIPIYVADFTKSELPNKVIVPNKDWLEIDESYKFKFSLYQNDLVKIKKKNDKEFYAYYNSTHRRTGAINLLTVNGEKKLEGIGVKTLELFEKYQVDILGNISKIRKEEREGISKK